METEREERKPSDLVIDVEGDLSGNKPHNMPNLNKFDDVLLDPNEAKKNVKS